jgi:hypothetical protein
MNCKSGDRAMVVRAHPLIPCSRACIGRVIVTVTHRFETFIGHAWVFKEGFVPCPKNPAKCKLVTFLDYELQPLPPEGEVRAHDRCTEMNEERLVPIYT